MGIDGESQDRNHGKWTDERGADASITEQPAPGTESSGEGPPSSRPAVGSESSSSSSPSASVPTLVLAGLMLLVLVTVAVIANNNRKNSTPEADEIVFEPEEVSLDEGSVVLNARYTTADEEYIQADGEEDIPLTIVKIEDSTDLYNVNGTLNSMMKVGIDGLDQGQLCTVEFLHDVTYTVQGTFSSAACKFELSVVMAPTESQLLSQDCSVSLNFDPSGFYIAPLPGKMAFTQALKSQKHSVFSFYLHDVALPRGVSCPSLSNP